MKFQYAFQQIVNLKNNERSQAEWNLSTAIGNLNHEESSLQELIRLKNEAQEKMLETSMRPVSMLEIRQLQSYVDHIEHLIARKRHDVSKAQRHVNHNRDLLNDKMIDEKVWTKARDKALEQFTGFVLKKEQEALDEIASNRHIRLSYQ
ncbi:flagellar export protein FliJ [Paenibacillus chitinolyticus]|uniref:flagellar export protein FliJ n=1 Tax=Paenibacillus chitinolyticus TaxID=79263 RepID=UPI001C488513|nr:flagellar export protein FliJ [Paenibacillus chitinolyticus]MBV6712918.1 flagellar export protein FliJ [Paenibacillus chitinolyticus]